MLSFKSVNPKNNKLLKEYQASSEQDIAEAVSNAFGAYKEMRDNGCEGMRERLEKLKKLQKILEEKREAIAETITNEMGKPIKSAREELQKCGSHIDYCVKKAE